ncbi:MAG: hypothetical protein PHR77_22000 [Kiritimatiellae bacterium]|nr:hypothetical protein [Kiritimatiellia bacterium]
MVCDHVIKAISYNHNLTNHKGCGIISAFRNMRNYVAGTSTPDMAISDAKSRKLGILLTVDQIQRPSLHRGLMRQAGESGIWTKRF